MYDLNNVRIISGGQSGVDRAALDFALNHKMVCGGYCPKGRLAEDGVISKIYPLSETKSSLYKERTRLNVEVSDALLVIYKTNLGAGTKLAIETAKQLKKDYFIIQLPAEEVNIEMLIQWLGITKPSSINIAGPRESSDKGIYLQTLKLLKQIFVTD